MIDRVVEIVCRRNAIRGEEAEELRSEIHLRLISDDYAILRKFDGRSSLKTYLTIVIQRLFLDFRNERWGKWRPSEAAKRLGDEAVLLETLMIRDGYGFDEALTMMRTNHGITTTRDELYRMTLAFPFRWGRSSVVEVELVGPVPANRHTPEQETMHAEILECEKTLDQVIRSEIEHAEPEDRVLLRMVHLEGRKISTIARTLQLDQGSLYRRLYRWQGRLRAALENRGLDWERISLLLEAGAPGRLFDLERIFESCPSKFTDEPAIPHMRKKGDAR